MDILNNTIRCMLQGKGREADSLYRVGLYNRVSLQPAHPRSESSASLMSSTSQNVKASYVPYQPRGSRSRLDTNGREDAFTPGMSSQNGTVARSTNSVQSTAGILFASLQCLHRRHCSAARKYCFMSLCATRGHVLQCSGHCEVGLSS